MTGHDDDLSTWHDDPLVRALRAPGTGEELAGEAELRTAFRAAQPAPAAPSSLAAARLRRAGRRLGGGGTAVAVVLALGGGAAAAAYTQNLPDRVQRAVHGVLGPVGVPAPEPPRTQAADGGSPGPAEPAPTTGSPTAEPDASPSEGPSDRPGDGSSNGPGTTPTKTSSDPTGSPTEQPSASPSESPAPSTSPTPTTPVAPPANVTLGGTSHRAAPDEQVALAGAVTASDESPVAGQEVSLQQRQAGGWVAVATASSDSSGTVALAAPALERTSVFRLGVGDTVASEPWRIVLTPTLSLTSAPSGTSTGIEVSAAGGQPGDVVALLSRRPGKDVVVGRSRLATDLTATFAVAAPSRRTTFVARLPRTRAHAAARSSIRVRPVRPTTVTAAVTDPVLGPDESVTVTGTASGEGGVVLPGRTVALMMRVRGGEWREVGSAVSDAEGSVSIPVGPIPSNAAVRLRVGRVASAAIALRLQPVWSSTLARTADGAVVTGAADGGDAGDRVLLRRLVDGRLTTVQQGVLTSGGTVRFEVPPPEGRRDRYRLVLLRTSHHLRALAKVVLTR